MAAATPTLAGQANNQNAANGRFFIGFWEGIDPLDGSNVQLSLTRSDSDRHLFDYIYRESFFTSCFTAENTKGRGVLIGTGILVERGVIEVVADITCFNDDITIGIEEDDIDVLIRAAPKGEMIVVIFPNTDFPSIIMHRVGH